MNESILAKIVEVPGQNKTLQMVKRDAHLSKTHTSKINETVFSR